MDHPATSALITLDIHEALTQKAGQKLLNMLFAHHGRLFRTVRGRTAMQVEREAWKYIKKTLRLSQSEGFDGLALIGFVTGIIPPQRSHA